MIALSPVESLQQLIEDLRCKGTDPRPFVPEGRLKAVVTKDNIRDVVAEFTPFENVQEVINFITKRALKIFGILVLINDAKLIENFIRADHFQCSDVDALLPMSTDTLVKILVDKRFVKRFHERQWEFCAPLFGTRIIPRILEQETILPYLSNSFLSAGAFGHVYRIKIHPKHRPQGYEDTTEFVRKEISLNDKTYENEVHVLSVLKALDHPNILKLIACYTYNEHHNIISPYIPNGSLRKFLKQDTPQTMNHARMFQLICGLVSAVWALHELVVGEAQPSHKGLHQDLRPDNVFYDGEKLILADFGLSSIKTPTEVSKTPFKHIPGYCTAPECVDLQPPFAGHDTTRATDIFALGCIITDMIVYLVKGPAGVQQFSHDREFNLPPMCYNLFHKGETANERVMEMLRDIAEEDGSKSLKSVVTLVSQMLDISPQVRPLAREVASRFYMITVKAYLERFDQLFDYLKYSPDAIIEAARFQSWTTALDEEYFANSVGPTPTAKMFTSVTERVQQFETALNCIDRNDSKLDHRTFIELRLLNNELLNMLPLNRMEIAHNCLSSIVLHKMGNNPKDYVYQTLISSFGEESGITQGVNTKQIVAQMNQIKAQTDMPPPSGNLIRTLSHIDRVGEYQISRVRGTAKQPAKYVLFESIRYQDQHRRKKLLPRVQALCKLLSSANICQRLSVLPFYGLHDKPNSYAFGILYDLSAAQNGEDMFPSIINLKGLLEINQPRLETRFKLALKLAESLAAFHDVDWYHKDLTCFNILFLQNDDDEFTWMYNPYLVGFQHSRQAADEFSEGPQQDKNHHRYHDPRYITGTVRHTRNFQSQYDYYSLGIVLLEIGLWNTVGREMQEHAQEDNASFSKILISEKLPKLGSAMSSKYVNAVTQCLTGWNQGDSNTDTNNGSSIEAKLLFRSKVIAPLRDLCSPFTPSSSPPLSDLKRKRVNSYGFESSIKRFKTQ